MDTVDIVNILLAIIAIIISVGAMILSLKWNKESENNLNEAKNILKNIEKTSDNIERNVSDKMDDILRRSFPSQQETIESKAMGDFFSSVLSGNIDFDKIDKLAEMADKFQKKG